MKSLIVALALTGGIMLSTPAEIPPQPQETAPEREYIGEYEVTAYSYHEGGGENYETASGEEPVPYYTVAATKDFAFGEKLYIEGIGEVCVQDRGAFPQGVIDLHIGYDDPVPWGRQERSVWKVN